VKADFARRVEAALADPVLQGALDQNAVRRKAGMQAAYDSLPEHKLLRQQARDIRLRTLANWDGYLAQFQDQLESNGYRIHWAANGDEACQIIVDIARETGATIVAKSKSMVTEEIELNHALQSAGMAVIETDLGEFIVQLRSEAPAHIITPAVHLTRHQVAQTFAQELQVEYDTDVETLTSIARRHLRQIFLKAQVGISGVNFGVAESGSLCLVTNEGNGRMVTTLPPVHVAVMGIERVVPTLDDLAVLLELLPRSATGQTITSYVSLIQGPYEKGEPDGPKERHLVMVDNGRMGMASSDLSEGLLCIRCGACLNACPVFREIGGHAYGSVYPGPIGSVVSPGLFGMERFGHLAKASTLCGACEDVCPVSIDLPGLLLQVRDEVGRRGSAYSVLRWAMRAFAWFAASPARFSRAQRWGYLFGSILPRLDGWLTSFPPRWRESRHFPPVARRAFRRLYQQREPEEVSLRSTSKPQRETLPYPAETESGNLLDRFELALAVVEGEVIKCRQDEAADQIASMIRSLEIKDIVSWSSEQLPVGDLLADLEKHGITAFIPDVDDRRGGARQLQIKKTSEMKVGLTAGLAGIADSGTIVVRSGEGRSQLASLLPEIHLVTLPASALYSNRRAWMAAQGRDLVHKSTAVQLITGPSRTADIEMTLTVGVHGPQRVIVFCLTDV
jgi:L-lactate dehydrogenase complex protein LldF